MFELADAFAIDVAAFAILSNHTHLVLHVDSTAAEEWSGAEVIERWHRLFNGTLLSQRYLAKDPLSPAEMDYLDQTVEIWRNRLQDISWFMGRLNEFIARRANAEDRCTGRFWEGRFKSQALLDEKALAACMVYVDLNPVRAGMAKTPEESDYTSVQMRAETAAKTVSKSDADSPTQPGRLLPFVGNLREEMPKGVPFHLADYLQVVDWTGRAIVDGKRGSIPTDLPPILERLRIEPKHWLYLARNFESPFKGLVGAAHTLRATCQRLGYQRTPSFSACKTLLT
ncbi:transposase [Endothiovibrio diazotrophicus]